VDTPNNGTLRAVVSGMKLTGLDVFDSTIQRTNTWLKELMKELNWSDNRKTYLALRCVLHDVRDHVPVNDAIRFGEQLPMLIRGFYFESWEPVGKPLPLGTRKDFLSSLSASMAHDGDNSSDPEVVARAVFRLLDRKVTEGEILDVQHLMPLAVLDLWPPRLRAA
jgi:uncharacterized protein (DUF2267 family)